jgi:hypothetical protein
MNSKFNFRSVEERMRNHDLSPRYNGYSYRYLIERAEPLDLLLFRGGDQISDLLRIGQENRNGNGDFSHVGIVVTSKILKLKTLEPGKLYIWESTFSYPIAGLSDGVPDVESGKGRFGVQIRDLEQVLNSQVGDRDHKAMGWSRLNDNPWTKRKSDSIRSLRKRRKQLRRRMIQLYSQIGSRYFENNLFGMLAALVPCMRIAREISDSTMIKGVDLIKRIDSEFRSLTTQLLSVGLEDDIEELSAPMKFPSADLDSSRALFCSEMVALIYIEMGILDRKVNPADMLPTDFITGHQVGERTILIFPISIK